MNNYNYPSTLEGKVNFVNNVVAPWLEALDFIEIEYAAVPEGEYIMFTRTNKVHYEIDVTADSIEGIVCDVTRWLNQNYLGGKI